MAVYPEYCILNLDFVSFEEAWVLEPHTDLDVAILILILILILTVNKAWFQILQTSPPCSGSDALDQG